MIRVILTQEELDAATAYELRPRDANPLGGMVVYIAGFAFEFESRGDAEAFARKILDALPLYEGGT